KVAPPSRGGLGAVADVRRAARRATRHPRPRPRTAAGVDSLGTGERRARTHSLRHETAARSRCRVQGPYPALQPGADRRSREPAQTAQAADVWPRETRSVGSPPPSPKLTASLRGPGEDAPRSPTPRKSHQSGSTPDAATSTAR